MPTVKTAIAVPKDIYERAEEVAGQMKLSRSALFTLAMEQLLERRETQEMIAQINAALGDGETEEEIRVRRGFQKLSARSILQNL